MKPQKTISRFFQEKPGRADRSEMISVTKELPIPYSAKLSFRIEEDPKIVFLTTKIKGVHYH